MTTFVFSDFFESTLAAAVATGDTVINVASATNSPTITTGQQWAIVVQSASTPSSREVMYVTAISSDAFTVTRAREGTAAGSWAVGDYVIGGNTEGVMAALGQLAATQTWSGGNTFSSGTLAVTASSGNVGLTLAAPGGKNWGWFSDTDGTASLYSTTDSKYAISVSTSFDVTALNGKMRAITGATGSGDTNACTILGDFPASLGNPGYTKLPNGLILQFGFPTAAASPGSANAVTFPITFPTAQIALVLTISNNQSSTQAAWELFGTTSGFSFACSATGVGVSYIALGY